MTFLGRIVFTHPGQDGMVRAVTVRTQYGEYKRPITKLCFLGEAELDQGLESVNRLDFVGWKCASASGFRRDFDSQLNEHVTMRNELMCFESFASRTVELMLGTLRCPECSGKENVGFPEKGWSERAATYKNS